MKAPVIVKIGSNVLTTSEGELNDVRLKHLVSELSLFQQKGIPIVLVSSGAVAAGRTMKTLPASTDRISQRQLWAALGQVALIQSYKKYFAESKLLCAQILVTKEDFRDRSHYVNMKNCLRTMLENDVIPIINENDVVSITELMFTDNDELAGLVASMVNAHSLIILSNVDGVFTGHPSHPEAQLIPEIPFDDPDALPHIASETSQFGRGGMLTKCTMARKTAALGIPVIIANGTQNGVLTKLLKQEPVGTRFLAHTKTASPTKQWLAHADSAFNGRVHIDEGAKKALYSDQPTSLLPVGITRIEGEFQKGDIVQIVDPQSNVIGLGKTTCDHTHIRPLMGKQQQKAFIHYDYLYLTP